MTDIHHVIVERAGSDDSVAATVAAHNRLKTLRVVREKFFRESAYHNGVPTFAFLLDQEVEYFYRPGPHRLKSVYLAWLYGVFTHHPAGEAERIPVQTDRWEVFP